MEKDGGFRAEARYQRDLAGKQLADGEFDRRAGVEVAIARVQRSRFGPDAVVRVDRKGDGFMPRHRALP